MEFKSDKGNYVTCQICGNNYKQINHFHLEKHGVTLSEYKLKYPNYNVCADYLIKIKSNKITGVNNPCYGIRRYGDDNPNYGNKSRIGSVLSTETKKKISETRKYRKIRAWNKGLTKHSNKSVAKGASKLIGRIRSKKHCDNISKSKKGMIITKEQRNKISKTLKDKFKNKDYALWWGKIHAVKPTRLEIDMKQFLDDNFPDEWVYTGDFKYTINGCNPDFISKDGKYLCIEVYHPFWKKRKYGSVERYKRLRRYRLGKYGWKVIFIDDVLLYKNQNKCIKKLM